MGRFIKIILYSVLTEKEKKEIKILKKGEKLAGKSDTDLLIKTFINICLTKRLNRN